MAHKIPLAVWVIWFRDHIHTDAEGKLAIFAKKRDAKDWFAANDMGEMSIRRMSMSLVK